MAHFQRDEDVATRLPYSSADMPTGNAGPGSPWKALHRSRNCVGHASSSCCKKTAISQIRMHDTRILDTTTKLAGHTFGKYLDCNFSCQRKSPRISKEASPIARASFLRFGTRQHRARSGAVVALGRRLTFLTQREHFLEPIAGLDKPSGSVERSRACRVSGFLDKYQKLLSASATRCSGPPRHA